MGLGLGLCKNGEKEGRVQMCMDLLTVDMIASSSQLLEYPEILHCVLEL